MGQTGYPRDRPEQLFTLVHLGHARTFNDEITEDVRFSVASSQEGGIDIEVGSSTMHMRKHCSMHHPVVQMVLFAIKHESQYTFCCPHSMVPKAILDIIEKTSVSEGAPLNSSGYGEERRDSKMYALVTPHSRRAGDGVLPPPEPWCRLSGWILALLTMWWATTEFLQTFVIRPPGWSSR